MKYLILKYQENIKILQNQNW